MGSWCHLGCLCHRLGSGKCSSLLLMHTLAGSVAAQGVGALPLTKTRAEFPASSFSLTKPNHWRHKQRESDVLAHY